MNFKLIAIARTSILALLLLLIAASQLFAADKLLIWWNKSYYPEEDQKLHEVVSAWEKRYEKKAELNFLTTEDIPKKLVAAIDSGTPPDIAFGHVLDLQYTPKWAYEGLLEDVSDIVLPMKNKWLPVVMDTVNLQNRQLKKKGYYGVPIEQQSIHIHYWANKLKELGLGEQDIPKEWNAFWNFWCDPVQKGLRAKGERTYGIGLTLSSVSIDTFMEINMFLNAYGITIMDSSGRLLVDDPAVRSGVAKVLEDFSRPYLKGCNPPDAVNWQDPDNNLSFLNKQTVMTTNPTLSIAASQYNANPDNYKHNIRTILWPNGPGGRPVSSMTAVKSALIFRDSKNKKDAKSFLAFLVRPENLGPYVKGSLGRWFPVTKQQLNDPYWKGTDDPHRKVEYRQYAEHRVLPFQQVYNHRYAAVQAENLWGKALGRMVLDGWSSEKATDELFKRMKEVMK